VNERADRMQRRVEVPLLVAALLTIPLVVIQQADAGAAWNAVADVLSWATWVAFLGEIVLMLRAVPDRGTWLREHPLELAIVVLTPPFLPAGMQAARVFRLLRLLRVVRAGMLMRRLLSTEGVRDAAVLAMVTIFAGGAGYAAVEKGQHLSTWDGVWWAITTVSTVGYGDTYPHTDAGRAIAIVVMGVGIGFIAILTAAAAERFLRAQRQEHHELAAVEAKLDEVLRKLDAVEAAAASRP
jgi:voltage-gated potassium channel